MSRIWRTPVQITDGVTLEITQNLVKTKWPKWELSFATADFISIEVKDKNLAYVTVSDEDDRKQRAFWGLTRSLLNNMIEWVSRWFTKTLEINGVWYKFEIKWTQNLTLSVGFSHKVEMSAPTGIELKMDGKKKNVMHISWIDKQLVGEFSAKIRAVKKPEPYKWKWIKYIDEHVRRKAGKAGSA